jgi:hypothetical protein
MIQEIMALGLPTNCVNHDINLVGVTKRPIPKILEKHQPSLPLEIQLRLGVKILSDSECLNVRFATVTPKVKLLDSQDMDHNVKIQRIELDCVIHVVAIVKDNCVHMNLQCNTSESVWGHQRRF